MKLIIKETELQNKVLLSDRVETIEDINDVANEARLKGYYRNEFILLPGETVPEGMKMKTFYRLFRLG